MSVYSSTAGFGPEVSPPFLYLEDPDNFANLVTIQGAHTIDLAINIGGALGDLSALTTAQYPEILAGENKERRKRVTFDHMLLQGRFAGSGALTVEVAGGRPPETPFRLDAVGEAGTLSMRGGAMRGFQAGRISLTLDGETQQVDQGELANMTGGAANVAGIYAALRDDIAAGTRAAPNFDHAVRLTQLIEDVLISSISGVRKQSVGWPTR